jgi:hypothetical protein
LTGFGYAQNFCCGAQGTFCNYRLLPCLGEFFKLLILLIFAVCRFSGHFKKALDLQGLRRRKTQLSTKLSTEVEDSCGRHDKSMTYPAFRQFN